MYTTTPQDAAPQDTTTPAPAASDELTWADRVLSEIPPCPIPSAGTGAFAARALRMSKDKASPKEDDKDKAIFTAMDFSAKFEDALSLVCALALADVCAGNNGARESWRRAMAARRLNDEACALLQGPMALPRPKVRR